MVVAATWQSTKAQTRQARFAHPLGIDLDMGDFVRMG